MAVCPKCSSEKCVKDGIVKGKQRYFIPNDIHMQSKAETYTVEGYNSLFRHFLARLRRKTKCYSKSKKMLLYSVMLLMLKWNDGLSAILN